MRREKLKTAKYQKIKINLRNRGLIKRYKSNLKPNPSLFPSCLTQYKGNYTQYLVSIIADTSTTPRECL